MIPDSEIRWAFSRSGGPGGQNVNRRETRVQLLFDLAGSSALSDAQKQIIRARPAVKHLLTEAGLLIVAVDTHRSQRANMDAARERLETLLRQALTPRKKRRPTKATRGSKERRLAAKKQQSQKKAGRGRVSDL